MELAHKTTILLTPELHARLAELARLQHKSLGALIRDACRAAYFQPTPQDAQAAVDAMLAMQLPVDEPEAMKQQANAPYKPLPGWDDVAP